MKIQITLKIGTSKFKMDQVPQKTISNFSVSNSYFCCMTDNSTSEYATQRTTSRVLDGSRHTHVHCGHVHNFHVVDCIWTYELVECSKGFLDQIAITFFLCKCSGKKMLLTSETLLQERKRKSKEIKVLRLKLTRTGVQKSDTNQSQEEFRPPISPAQTECNPKFQLQGEPGE